MGERLLCKQEVIGSIPFTSTRCQKTDAQKTDARMETAVGSRLLWHLISEL